jgi:hypothetical protein
VHERDYILTVHEDVRASRRAERHMENGPILGGVDARAREHRLRPLAEAGGVGQRHKEAQRLAGHAVLRKVQVKVARGRGEPLAAGCVRGEQVA